MTSFSYVEAVISCEATSHGTVWAVITTGGDLVGRFDKLRDAEKAVQSYVDEQHHHYHEGE